MIETSAPEPQVYIRRPPVWSKTLFRYHSDNTPLLRRPRGRGSRPTDTSSRPQPEVSAARGPPAARGRARAPRWRERRPQRPLPPHPASTGPALRFCRGTSGSTCSAAPGTPSSLPPGPAAAPPLGPAAPQWGLARPGGARPAATASPRTNLRQPRRSPRATRSDALKAAVGAARPSSPRAPHVGAASGAGRGGAGAPRARPHPGRPLLLPVPAARPGETPAPGTAWEAGKRVGGCSLRQGGREGPVRRCASHPPRAPSASFCG